MWSHFKKNNIIQKEAAASNLMTVHGKGNRPLINSTGEVQRLLIKEYGHIILRRKWMLQSQEGSFILETPKKALVDAELAI